MDSPDDLDQSVSLYEDNLLRDMINKHASLRMWQIPQGVLIPSYNKHIYQNHQKAHTQRERERKRERQTERERERHTHTHTHTIAGLAHSVTQISRKLSGRSVR